MELKEIIVDIEKYPDDIRPLLLNAKIFDCSCSPEAKVIYIDKYAGYFCKTAPKGSLKREYEMTKFYNSLGLSPKVLSYLSLEQDWLITEKVIGNDCIAEKYLAKPEKLCDTIAVLLSQLHSLKIYDCPIPSHSRLYVDRARQNYINGTYDKAHFPDSWGYKCAEDAWFVVNNEASKLKDEVLLHGDYCLPNIILNNWNFSGFIDVDNGGIGDRHVDLFWGVWTLFFNLKTDKYRERFFDVYGRDKIDMDMFELYLP